MPTALITGGHKGIGLSAVETIAAAGTHDIVLAGRNLPEVEQAAQRLQARYRVKVRSVLMNVSSRNSVREGLAAFKTLLAQGDVGPLDILMLNAGAQWGKGTHYSVDGYELTFATNCLGHFLLLNLVLDDLRPDGRVVFTVSGTHDPDTMDGKMVGAAAAPDAIALASDGKQGKGLKGGQRYASSKLCFIMYAYELDRKLKAKHSGIQSIAFDPGLVSDTELGRWAPKFLNRMMVSAPFQALFRKMGVTMGSLEVSGGGLAATAIDPAFAAASGKYIQSRNGAIIEAQSSRVSYDEGLAAKLWQDSATLVGLGAEEQPRRLN